MREGKGNGILWAEKKLGRKLDVHQSGPTQYVNLSGAELRKLTAGPSPFRMMLFIFGGFAAARLFVWLAEYLSS